MSSFLKFGFIALLFELAVLGQFNLADNSFVLLGQDKVNQTDNWSVRAISNDLEKSFEFVELPNSNENSEEDEKLKNTYSGTAQFFDGFFNNENHTNCFQSFLKVETFNGPSLIILYHSWKFHFYC